MKNYEAKIPSQKEASITKKRNVPEIGDEFYIDTAFYLSHGRDDRIGGLVRINGIKEDDYWFWVSVDEIPDTRFGINKKGPRAWSGKERMKEQRRLKNQFGNQRARHVPDDRPEFNEW